MFSGSRLSLKHFSKFFSPSRSLIGVHHLINLLSRTNSFLVTFIIPLSNPGRRSRLCRSRLSSPARDAASSRLPSCLAQSSFVLYCIWSSARTRGSYAASKERAKMWFRTVDLLHDLIRKKTNALDRSATVDRQVWYKFTYWSDVQDPEREKWSTRWLIWYWFLSVVSSVN